MNFFVIQWSASEKMFSLLRSDEMIERNINCLIRKQPNDFVPIYLCHSRDEAEIALEDLNKKVMIDGLLNLRELRHVLEYLI